MKLAYYPGCSAEGSGIEYKMSAEKIADILGIELVELKDWNCCGATSGHNTDHLLALALPARNLALAEKEGLTEMVAPCAACYNRHRSTELTIRRDLKMRAKIEQAIDTEIKGTVTTLSIVDVLANRVAPEVIASKVTKPFTGMKAACYYGCLLVRPSEITGFDDAEDPQSMDRLMRIIGADPIEWPFKTECCGAALVTSRPDVGNRMMYKILENAKENGAECIVTACPLCMLNLDMRQTIVEKEYGTKFDLTVYYITELMALACGVTQEEAGTKRHFVPVDSYLVLAEKRAAELQAAAAEAKAKSEKKADKAETAEDPETIQKKISAMIKGWEKNPDKMAARVLDDEEKINILSEIVAADEKKRNKMAELMVTDQEKAAKAAEAYISAELKKRAKT